MSFSSKVKSEVAKFFADANHCNIAEMSALINMCGHIDRKYDNIKIKVQTENIHVATKFYLLLKKTFLIDAEVSVKRSSQAGSNSIYSVVVNKNNEAVKLLTVTGMLKNVDNDLNIINDININIINKMCCKRAYIRGAFLAAGSVSNPEKTYHLEFAVNHYRHSLSLQNLINYFNMDAKMIERKGHYVVYLKEGEKIVDLLNVIGAHISLMDLENLRIIKDMRNNVNRLVNCETANLNKTVSASIKQLSEIEYIQETIGLNSLPELLEEVAIKRLMYPEASLKELGEMLSPTVGKSGVNHRLKKISAIAETIKQKV